MLVHVGGCHSIEIVSNVHWNFVFCSSFIVLVQFWDKRGRILNMYSIQRGLQRYSLIDTKLIPSQLQNPAL